MMEGPEKPVLVTRSSLPPLEEYVEMLKPIWDSAWLTNMGAYHEEFKKRLKETAGVSARNCAISCRYSGLTAHSRMKLRRVKSEEGVLNMGPMKMVCSWSLDSTRPK